MTEAERAREAGELAKGCCSAISPCAHQRRDPATLCETCSTALAARQQAPADATGGVGTENNLARCTSCGAPEGMDCRTVQGRIPPCPGRAALASSPAAPAQGDGPVGWIGDLTLQRLKSGQDGKIYPTDPGSTAGMSIPVYAAPAQAGSREEAVAGELFTRIRDCWDEDECPSFVTIEPLFDQLLALATPPATRSEEEIRREALEEAAKIADEQIADAMGPADVDKAYRMACYDSAEAIRARAGKPATAGEVR